jgi:hypothetical protein
MSTRYVVTAANTTERNSLVQQVALNGGICYRRDSDTLDILDPDTGTWYSVPVAGLSNGVFGGTTGATGVQGAVTTESLVIKAVTAFADTTAKAVFTVTVPNAVHAAGIEVDCLGVLGAGGAIGAGESTMRTKYVLTLARTAGLACVVGVSTVVGSANAKVAGADDITSVVVTASAMTGATSATQTFTINVAITRSGAGATNHTGVFVARLVNQNTAGVTIA